MQLPLGRLTAALVAIIAVAAVAASLPIVVETPDDSGGAPEEVPEVTGQETERGGSEATIIIRAVQLATLVLVVFTLLAFVLHDRRELLRRVLMASAAVAVIVVAWRYALQSMDVSWAEPQKPIDVAVSMARGDGSSGDAGDSSQLPVLGLGIVVLGLVFAGLVIKTHLGESDDPDKGLGATADVGSVAGDAADRIESESVGSIENAVYDAWYRMTTYLPVENPETSTPGEFAAAAVDAGLDRDDVEELTSLFESVRYGPETASGVTERRAVEILRRIESTYAESETASAADGSETGVRSGVGKRPSTAVETDADGSTGGPARDPSETEPGRDGDDR